VTVYPFTEHHFPEGLNLLEFTLLQITVDTSVTLLLSRSGERKLEVWCSRKRQQCAVCFEMCSSQKYKWLHCNYWLFDTSDLQHWLHKMLSWISLSTCQIYKRYAEILQLFYFIGYNWHEHF